MGFSWVTINVKNLEESLSFYEDVVGLKVNRRMSPMPGTEIAFLGDGNSSTEVELIRNEKNNDPGFGRDISIGFTVESIENTIEILNDRGINHIEGPFQPGPFIKFIFITDPDGLRVQFIENLE